MVPVDRRAAHITVITSVASLRLEWPTENGSASLTIQRGPNKRGYIRGLIGDVDFFNNTVRRLEKEKARGEKANPAVIKDLEMQLAEARSVLPVDPGA